MREWKTHTIYDPCDLEGGNHPAGIQNHHPSDKRACSGRLCELGEESHL